MFFFFHVVPKTNYSIKLNHSKPISRSGSKMGESLSIMVALLGGLRRMVRCPFSLEFVGCCRCHLVGMVEKLGKRLCCALLLQGLH